MSTCIAEATDLIAGGADISGSTVVSPLIDTLAQLHAVVLALDDQEYTRNPVGVVQSSVALHVRHCLDHVRSLLSGVQNGRMNYDHRERGTDVEISRRAALRAISDLQQQLTELPEDLIDQPVRLSVLLRSSGQAIDVRTSIGREAAYVLSHTIHHNAFIAAMVKTMGGWLPERFGYAPSTLANQERRRSHVHGQRNSI